MEKRQGWGEGTIQPKRTPALNPEPSTPAVTLQPPTRKPYTRKHWVLNPLNPNHKSPEPQPLKHKPPQPKSGTNPAEPTLEPRRRHLTDGHDRHGSLRVYAIGLIRVVGFFFLCRCHRKYMRDFLGFVVVLQECYKSCKV